MGPALAEPTPLARGTSQVLGSSLAAFTPLWRRVGDYQRRYHSQLLIAQRPIASYICSDPTAISVILHLCGPQWALIVVGGGPPVSQPPEIDHLPTS